MNFKRIFLVLILITVVLSLVASLSIIFHGPRKKIFWPSPPKYKKKVSLDKANIYVLGINGIIHFSENLSPLSKPYNDAEYYVRKLKRLKDYPNIKAVILKINSPGGTIAATQTIYNQIMALRKRGVVVVSVIKDLGASGAYYIACSSDSIFVQPGSLVGSIGVIVGGANLKKLFEKLGVEYNVFKSGKYKDILAPYRDLTDEEKGLLKDLVDSAFSDFYIAVKENRKLTDEDMALVADGRLFTGKMAKEKGLVDELGDEDDAIEFIRKRAKILKPRIYEDMPSPLFELRYIFSSRINEYFELLNALNKIPIAYIYAN